MLPLFESGQFESGPVHMRWRVPKDKDHVGKTLLLAGAPVGLKTHRVGKRTWPCLYNWPKLGKECPHCERSRRWTTWVPVLTCDHQCRQLILMGGETTWKSVKGLKRGSFVVCRYAQMLKPTLMFFPHQLQVGVSSSKMVADLEGIGNGDITRWLLHYWQWTELTKWYHETPRDSIKTSMLKDRAEEMKAATSQTLPFSNIA